MMLQQIKNPHSQEKVTMEQINKFTGTILRYPNHRVDLCLLSAVLSDPDRKLY